MTKREVFQRYQPVNCRIDISPFLLGIARIFDFASYLDHPGRMQSSEIDKRALQSDLIAIGQDFRTVIDKENFE